MQFTIRAAALVRALSRLAPRQTMEAQRSLATWNRPVAPWLCRTSACRASRFSGLDRPAASHIPTPSPLVLHVNTMKKKTAIKRRCKDCKIVIKDKRAYVICKTSPRHNQVQG